MATVHTPVGGFTGTVAGVQFKDGTAETDDASALAYFARKGYRIDGQPSEPAGFDDDRPAKSAPKAEWVAYADSQGVTGGDEMTKTEIIEQFD